jgi:hypothetical protein
MNSRGAILGGALLVGTAAIAVEPAAEPVMPIAAPAPYSAPFALRGVMPANVVRLDSSMATSSTTAGSATSVVQFLTVGLRVSEHLALNVRAGWVDLARSPTVTGSAVTDVAFGAQYGLSQGDFRFAAVAGFGLPLAAGGGDAPAPEAKAAIGSGALSRAGMDNAMFGPNDVSLTVGGDAAYVKSGFIAQAEATLIQSFRVRAANTQPDSAKTNSTYGLSLGYFLIPQLTAGTELRYQRFLSTPAAVAADTTGASRDSLSVAVGARGHFAFQKAKLHPGFSVAFGLDDPMSSRSIKIYQFDLAANF